MVQGSPLNSTLATFGQTFAFSLRSLSGSGVFSVSVYYNQSTLLASALVTIFQQVVVVPPDSTSSLQCDSALLVPQLSPSMRCWIVPRSRNTVISTPFSYFQLKETGNGGVFIAPAPTLSATRFDFTYQMGNTPGAFELSDSVSGNSIIFTAFSGIDNTSGFVVQGCDS
eukprot:TRINITY_DN11166_c0_g1_i1.p2 TRINITY_DN11166_c0_g1~~TRINITY_DN11166_c0_g1_i1.p2  ORF type:complete len:169 (+),score=38.95 TRINITY_DN11166_c0_g1_i1:57-563(+)